MVLNVDLQCSKCYKKVKKLLCKFLEESKEPEKKKEAEDSQETGPPPFLVPLPLGFCCDECYSGRPGGPCWRGGRVQYYGCYGRTVNDSWGGGGCASGYAYCCSEQNQHGCTIM
ncbi:hypothetical protein SLE2022_323010 [Rubroshorea leprosula]